MVVNCKLEKRDNGFWYGYCDGILVADGCITKFGAKRRIRKSIKILNRDSVTVEFQIKVK